MVGAKLDEAKCSAFKFQSDVTTVIVGFPLIEGLHCDPMLELVNVGWTTQENQGQV